MSHANKFSIIRGQLPNLDELMTPQERVQLKRCIQAAKTDSMPPICTHNMVEDSTDDVLNALRRCNLFNQDNDRVKVCYRIVLGRCFWWRPRCT